MYTLAQKCPQKDGEIILAARSLYNYLTDANETFDNSCNGLVSRKAKVVVANKHFPSAITLYPNPNTGNFILRYPPALKGTNTVTIMNLLGKVVFSKILLLGTHNIELNNTLSSGMYILSSKNSKTGKIEIKKLIVTTK